MDVLKTVQDFECSVYPKLRNTLKSFQSESGGKFGEIILKEAQIARYEDTEIIAVIMPTSDQVHNLVTYYNSAADEFITYVLDISTLVAEDCLQGFSNHLYRRKRGRLLCSTSLPDRYRTDMCLRRLLLGINSVSQNK